MPLSVIMRNMKKILILTSIRTGSGHRSSANAIEKKLNDAGFMTRQLNVFPLMGKTGVLMENSYIPLTTKAPFIYYLCERFSERFPWFIHTEMYVRIRRNLLKEIREFDPDLIISVQCMFTRSVSRIIRKEKLKIPFYVDVIDLVNPPSVWRDRNADVTFVPTEAIRDDYLKRGFDKNRVLVSGFPVRDDIIVNDRPKKIDGPVNVLMVNASTDLKTNIRFLKEVLRLKNVSVDFICGLDKHLFNTLYSMKKGGELPTNVHIHPFVGNMNEFLAKSHLILTKAGPNVIVESVRSGTVIVITGHIHGQEDNNYRFVIDNGYGIRCEDPGKIYGALSDMIGSGSLERYLNSVVAHGIGNGAEFIADYVSKHI